jgi:hypothetical protein
MFDEAQVTQVDKLQGNIREMRSLVQKPDALAGKATANTVEFQTLLIKARDHAHELSLHLEKKAQETKNSKEHYAVLMENISGIDSRLAAMKAATAPDLLDKELSRIESNIYLLTKQTPYTLLMMRVVEIGLPLLLSLFTFFFLFRYNLTETRSHEIKALLVQRNAKEAETNPEIAHI